MEPKARHCFEVSWEVCNKVGGIYTVVSSKAKQMMNKYGEDNYTLIGPYFPEKVKGIFQETVPPQDCQECVNKLKEQGIEVHTGKWLIKGEPNVMLIDFSGYANKKNEIKKALWDNYQIDTLRTDYYDYDEPAIWGWATGMLIQELSKLYKKTVAHFHEWLAGPGLLYLQTNKAKVATTFTTHATVLGRTLSTQRLELYEVLDKLNPDEEAKKQGWSTLAKHQTEKASAQNAHIFTTVSEITGIEAEKILGRKPEVLVLNGLDMDEFPTYEQASIKHKQFKARIKQFLLFYFFPYYSFDLDNVLFYFLAGRYEFHDKGIDIFIQALGKLNKELKKDKKSKTIIAFFWVPGNVKSIKHSLLENRTHFFDIKDQIDDHEDEILNRLLFSIIAQKELSRKALFNEDTLQDLKRKTLRLLKKGNPPQSTHDLFNEDNDQIIRALRQEGLENSPEDKVKVVFYPIYLTGADNLLDTDYYESMMGSHLGIFPSVYEPWGYTPLEAAALGVSSVTTDLSGFGRYICKECEQGDYPGVWVIERYGKGHDYAVEQLAKIMQKYAQFEAQERAENKVQARKLAQKASWEEFIENYIDAHNKACKKIFK